MNDDSKKLDGLSSSAFTSNASAESRTHALPKKRKKTSPKKSKRVVKRAKPRR